MPDQAAAHTSASDLFPTEQIRLAEVSVYNWGPFIGCHTARIDPDGTLITGETGAGKSSLIDALQPLFLPPGKALFNTAAAQSAKDDRSLVTYVRGKFRADEAEGGNAYGGYSRPHSTSSAIRGLYRSGDREFTFIALFWITGVSVQQGDVARLYLVANSNLSLPEILEHFRERDTRVLKAAFKSRPDVEFFHSFEAYRVRYQDMLYFENPNAPGLLTRALGLKKIEDLTQLIQNFVLDPGNIRDTAVAAVKGFRDLETVHAELLDTREREHYLSGLPELRGVIELARTALARLARGRVAYPVFLAREWMRLLSTRLQAQKISISTTRLLSDQATAAKEAAETHWKLMHELYVRAGGGAIEKLEIQLTQARDELRNVVNQSKQYMALAGSLGCPTIGTPAEFAVTHAAIEAELKDEDGTKNQLFDAAARASRAHQNVIDELSGLARELASAQKRRDSAIPDDYAGVRAELCDHLGVSHDRLMFIAELIDVLPTDEAWRGAIERAVGALKLTLAVPEALMERAADWVNGRHLGINLNLRTVTTTQTKPQLYPDSYLHKLSWRDHPHQAWAKIQLASNDLHCVSNAQECHDTPNSMTIQGLIHRRKGSFEKRDRLRINDTREWCIGYTNTARIQRLEKQIADGRAALTEAAAQLETARDSQRSFDTRASQMKSLLLFSWPKIDITSAQAEVERVGDALKVASSAGDQLELARTNLQTAKEALDASGRDAFKAERLAEEAARALQASVEASARYEMVAGTPIDDEGLVVAFEVSGPRKEADLDSIPAVEAEVRSAIDALAQGHQGKENKAVVDATRIISGFASKWTAIAGDWTQNVSGIDEYVQHYESIVAEGLPKLVERFAQMLTQHSTQSLAGVRQQIRNERENILDRIESINRVMSRTELRKDTFLELEARQISYPLNVDYDKKVTRALELVTSNDHEERYKALKDAIDILSKATDPASAGSKESTRLLDPRFQFEFVAKELQKGTRDVKDVWTSSGGKSGGEKETFAGTIVAASLAYVLSPNGSDKPIYSTVFLDEAFSNTSVVYSRRVLKTFRELRLHLNLITPFKNIELARDCARLLVLVRKDDTRHISSLSEVTWEYIDQRLQQRAGELGITIEEGNG